MSTRTLTVRQFATIKRVAQNVNPLVVKKNKIIAKIEELNKELGDLVTEIEGHEMGVKALTGMASEDLITKKVEDTGKVDKDNHPIKVTKYEPKEGVVFYNEEKNLYEIHIGDTGASQNSQEESVENPVVTGEFNQENLDKLPY